MNVYTVFYTTLSFQCCFTFRRDKLSNRIDDTTTTTEQREDGSTQENVTNDGTRPTTTTTAEDDQLPGSDNEETEEEKLHKLALRFECLELTSLENKVTDKCVVTFDEVRWI